MSPNGSKKCFLASENFRNIWRYGIKNVFLQRNISNILRRKVMRQIEDSLKAYRDIKNSLDTAMEQGFEKGRA